MKYNMFKQISKHFQRFIISSSLLILTAAAIYVAYPGLVFIHPIIHAVIEWFGVFASFLLVVFLVVEGFDGYRKKDIFLAAAFLSMGTMLALHPFLYENIDSYHWLFSIAGVIGGIFLTIFAYYSAWEVTIKESRVVSRNGIYIFLLVVFIFSFGYAVFCLLYPWSFPAMVRDGEFTTAARVVNLLAGVLFLLGNFIFSQNDQKTPMNQENQKDLGLLTEKRDFGFFPGIFILFFSGAMIFLFSSPWSPGYWIIHFIRVITAMLITGFMIYRHGRVYDGLKKEIVERRRAEEDALNAHAELNQVFKTAADGIRVIDRDYNVIRVNESFARMANISQKKAIGRKCYEIFPGNSCHTPGCPLERIVKEGDNRVEYEVIKHQANGKNLSCLVVATPFRNPYHDEIIGIIESFVDISERVRAEEARRILIYDLGLRVRELTFLLNIDRKIEKKPSIEELLDYIVHNIPSAWQYSDVTQSRISFDEVVYGPMWKFLPLVAVQRVNLLVQGKNRGFIEVGYVENKENRLERGSDLFLKEEHDLIEGIAERLGNYITQRELEIEKEQWTEELERQVSDRTAQLQEANKELEAFSYSVSHDLRMPVRHIDGFSKILLESYPIALDPKIIHYLNIIRQSAIKMGQLIEALLHFSHLGKKPVNRQSVNIFQMINELVMERGKEIADRQVKLVIAPDLPTVYSCDPELTRIVFFNLVDNALKFTRHQNEPKIEIGVKRERDIFIFWVSDNGIGFDMRYVSKIFGVFQQLHNNQQEFEGVGVGLSTVQRIINKHEGEIWVDSKVGEGTTFYFCLEGGKPGVRG